MRHRQTVSEVRALREVTAFGDRERQYVAWPQGGVVRIWSTDLGGGLIRWTAASDDRTVISMATRDQRPHTAEVDRDGDYETIRIIDADGATRSMTRRWLRAEKGAPMRRVIEGPIRPLCWMTLVLSLLGAVVSAARTEWGDALMLTVLAVYVHAALEGWRKS